MARSTRAHRFHDGNALLLGLVLGEERAEEAGLLLHIDVEVAVVELRGGGPAALAFDLLGFVGVQFLSDNCHRLVAVEEVRVSSVDIARLHAVTMLTKPSVISAAAKTYATKSETSFVVGFMAFLKKLTTTELKRSFRAGNRLNACWMDISKQCIMAYDRTAYNLLEELAENTDEFIIHKLAALQRRVLQPPDLLLHDDLERLRPDEQRRRRARRVVQNRPDVPILNLVEWIDRLDAVVEQLVEHETDTRTTRELVQRQVVGVTVDGRPELGAELGDDVEDDARRAGVAERAAERLQLGVEFLQLL